MQFPNLLYGPGYNAGVLPGFTVVQSLPAFGIYHLLPPGSTPFDVPAIVQVRAVNQMDVPVLAQQFLAFDNPIVAMANAANLGLVNVLSLHPYRQLILPQGLTHVREFDAVTVRGLPARVMVMLIVGPQSAVEVILMVNIYRWTEFLGPCLEFVKHIQLAGAAPATSAQLEAVVDRSNQQEIEYQMVTPTGNRVPLTSMPVMYGGTIIVNDYSFKVGHINGTNIAVGHHSRAALSGGEK